MWRITKITPSIGAEISGVDFSQPIPSHTFDKIYDALIENLVVFLETLIFLPHNT